MNQKQNQNQIQNQTKNLNQNNRTAPGTYLSSPASGMLLNDAHGNVRYGMTNDYMFRAVLQSSNRVLRGLVCSLLHLTEEEVVSVVITNPIILGEAVENKEFRLDINVVLNDHTLINLEMQVANRLNWKKRSVMYLCRSFDSLNHGQPYDRAKPAVHIGFLDYSLSDGRPEFYSTYKLLNVKNHQIYSDSLTLSVVDLSHIELATGEDRRYHINDWAALLKAATWEEIRMLASKNEYLNEAAQTIYRMSAEEQIRKRCRDREEYYQDLQSYERAVAERDSAIAERDNTISDYEKTLAENEAQIQQLLAEIEMLKAQQ